MTQLVEVGQGTQVMDSLHLLATSLWRAKDIVTTWDDDTLIQNHAAFSNAEFACYAASCLICSTLADRYSGTGQGKEAGYRRAAELLTVSPRTAKDKALVWENILVSVEPDDAVTTLPQDFFSKALSAKRNDVDAIEALRYAVHKRNVLGRGYEANDFRADIRAGLPDPDDEGRYRPILPSCGLCKNHKLSPEDARLFLVWGQETLADATAEGQRYCEKYHLLTSDLGNLNERARQCPSYDTKEGE